jgi:hypothetical protein
MQARLAELEHAVAKSRQTEQEAETRLLVQRGEADAILRRQNAELTEARNRASRFAINAALDAALDRHPLGPHSRAQLRVIFGADLRADTTQDGEYSVRTTDTFEPVQAYVDRALDSQNFRHFLNQTAPSPAAPRQAAAAPPAEPKSLSDRVIEGFHSRQAAIAAKGVDPRTNEAVAFGLKPVAARRRPG